MKIYVEKNDIKSCNNDRISDELLKTIQDTSNFFKLIESMDSSKELNPNILLLRRYAPLIPMYKKPLSVLKEMEYKQLQELQEIYSKYQKSIQQNAQCSLVASEMIETSMQTITQNITETVHKENLQNTNTRTNA